MNVILCFILQVDNCEMQNLMLHLISNGRFGMHFVEPKTKPRDHLYWIDKYPFTVPVSVIN